MFANRAAHFLQTRRQQFFRVKGSFARQQFVEQHTQAVNVGTGVNIQSAQTGLFRAHVSGCAHELFERGEKRLVREPLVGSGLGNAEVNHLGHRHSVMIGHEDIGGLDVAVDYAFLMRMLDGLTNLGE